MAEMKNVPVELTSPPAMSCKSRRVQCAWYRGIGSSAICDHDRVIGSSAICDHDNHGVERLAILSEASCQSRTECNVSPFISFDGLPAGHPSFRAKNVDILAEDRPVSTQCPHAEP